MILWCAQKPAVVAQSVALTNTVWHNGLYIPPQKWQSQRQILYSSCARSLLIVLTVYAIFLSLSLSYSILCSDSRLCGLCSKWLIDRLIKSPLFCYRLYITTRYHFRTKCHTSWSPCAGKHKQKMRRNWQSRVHLACSYLVAGLYIQCTICRKLAN